MFLLLTYFWGNLREIHGFSGEELSLRTSLEMASGQAPRACHVWASFTNTIYVQASKTFICEDMPELEHTSVNLKPRCTTCQTYQSNSYNLNQPKHNRL